MIAFLFFLQLIVGGLVAIMSINVHNFDQLLFAGTTDVTIVFGDNEEYFNVFLELIEENNLIATKMMPMDFENITLYATDVTFDHYITLSEGRFPKVGSHEFISNVNHDDEKQVGKIGNMTPNFNITIKHLENTQGFNIDGTYRLHTNDTDLLIEIRDKLLSDVTLFQISQPMEDDRNFVTTVMMGIFTMPTLTGTVMIILIPIITFFCMGATLLQFSLSQAKESFTLHVHGYSKRRIIAGSLKKLFIPLLGVGFLAYLLLYAYLVITRLSIFNYPFTLSFLAFYAALLFVTGVTVIAVMYLTFQIRSSHVAIKGYKPDFAIQVLNHFLKMIFMALFLVGSHYVVVHVFNLSIQRAQLQNWESARHVHQIAISHFWPLDSDEYDNQINQLEQFRLALSESHGAFIMNSNHIYNDDHFSEWAPRDEDAPPFYVDPNGNRVDITLNYLNLNPIQTVNGLTIEEQIVWDEFVVNLLVPIELAMYEDLIKELYLQDFYFGSLSWKNRDNYLLGLSTNEYTIDDGAVNLIYVESEQYYFTFNARVRPEDGNRIKDPIAVVHTDHFHPLFMLSLISSSLYFVSDHVDPFSEIAEVVEAYDLSYSIRFAQSVFAENAERIRLLKQDQLSGLLALSALVITNLTVHYNLISNYFWRNKHALFTQALFGFSPLKRHRGFILSFLVYVIPLIVITTFFLGWIAWVIAMLFLALEILLAVVFERRLMRKSFAEIMKGER